MQDASRVIIVGAPAGKPSLNLPYSQSGCSLQTRRAAERIFWQDSRGVCMRTMRTPVAYNARGGNTKAVEVEIIRAPGGAEAEGVRGAGDGHGLRSYWRSLREVMLRPIAGGDAPGARAGDEHSGMHHSTRHKRSIIAGKTDYTDVTLPEIVADIHDWSRACDTVSAHLVLCKNEIVQQGQSPQQ